MLKSVLTLAALVLFAAPTFAADGEISGDLPRSMASPVRLSPVAGASSFSTGANPDFSKFDQGFSAGIFADIGNGGLVFETGILTLGATQNRTNTSATVNVQNWGIPLLAKLNFSGKPHETLFVKAGAMPFNTTGGDTNAFNIMGVAGIGADIPLGRYSSLLLDASYNRMFTRNGDVTNTSGIALLAGLSFNL